MRKIVVAVILLLNLAFPLVRANPQPVGWNPYSDLIVFFVMIILGVAFLAFIIYSIRKKGINKSKSKRDLF
jgi:hypothetical protein